MHVREAAGDDVERLHAINAAGEPGVGAVSAPELCRLLDMADVTLVADDGSGDILGFILCMTEGAPYASPNYRWIAARYAAFAYCDRIAVAATARGRGVGERLYAEAFARFTGRRDVMLCEVNLAPPNPGSLRFHERLGFRAVGEAWYSVGTKGVVFLARALPAP